ncbi:hypothetical protein RF11_04463 [Thelohanellus kitauei]|uniref:Uncharacterized protein n=1 Tax=Thelohanellus kitauei TaxID=669202 RepID=A0A0C2ILY0_THEKT|nr:hypothetical protein RF11_02089 [Thelohanellus kitauei]KII69282.1 hypothetical protein RF11_04463 [Thelohanellus kitauei]
MDSIITDCSQTLGGQNIGLLRRLSDHVSAIDFNEQLIFFYCIKDLEILCKGVIDMKHVKDLHRTIMAVRCSVNVDLLDYIKELTTNLQANGICANEMFSIVRAIHLIKILFYHQPSH